MWNERFDYVEQRTQIIFKNYNFTSALVKQNRTATRNPLKKITCVSQQYKHCQQLYLICNSINKFTVVMYRDISAMDTCKPIPDLTVIITCNQYFKWWGGVRHFLFSI